MISKEILNSRKNLIHDFFIKTNESFERSFKFIDILYLNLQRANQKIITYDI